MKAVIQDLRKRHGASKLYLAGTGAGCISALYAAKDQDREVGGLILAGAGMNRLDEFDFSGLKVPVLVIHHVEDGCDSAPAIEAGELARKHRFAFVPVAGGDPDNGRNLCNMLTRHGFRGSEKGVSGAMAEWVSGKVPKPLAPAEAPFFLNEQVYWIPAGDVKLQTTVYRPEGKGPFPLVVMNHGVPPDKVKMQLEKFRHRYGSQAREFVKRGFVVAIPMRRGFGKSGGSYNDNFNNSYAFGLKDAADIRAVVEFMKNQPYVDGKRLVMLGQSGGGLASLAYGSEGDPSLLGIINFAGGIKSTGRGPWEHLLVETFGSYAKTTKVPSVWFYTENDSYFPPGLARSLHESYVRNNGRAKFLQLPPFKKDGHTLFYDSDGIPLWTAEIDAFLAGIGLQGKQ
jgi:dienelactone hydrolase